MIRNNKQFDIPILFITFNRIECTFKVFDEIKKIKPQKLYISSDGPRENNSDDISKIKYIQKNLKQKIDWDCEVHEIFNEKNLGCKKAISKAIKIFFDENQMGIILEDDCLPDQSFFEYTKQNLIFHKKNKEISIISGSRFTHNGKEHLSKYAMIWGWASWSDRFSEYKPDIDFSISYIHRTAKLLSNNLFQYLYWVEILIRLSKGKISAGWDLAFLCLAINNRQKSIVPPKNLITNIGVGNDATNNQHGSIANFRKRYKLNKYNPKKNIINIKSTDNKIFKNFFCSNYFVLIKRYIRLCLRVK